ncbi:MAG: hypothetical protein NTX64_05850 [Elusimicrobia bacterium]|nr:hypothetical protein [Elusimicrobiota bacterium]
MGTTEGDKGRLGKTKFSFGTTSAIITNLALICGLDAVSNPKRAIVGGILVIALADNFSDSMGIHVFQESEGLGDREVWFSTVTNFLSRVVVSFSFIGLILALPLRVAVPCAVAWGLSLLAVMSYAIARDRGANPRREMLIHLCMAVFVIGVSHFVGDFLAARF